VMESKGVLVFAEQKNGKLHKVSFELLGVGRKIAEKLGSELYAAVLGPFGRSSSKNGLSLPFPCRMNTCLLRI